MSTDLIAFLNARLDEDKASAAKAQKKRRSPWRVIDSIRMRVISGSPNRDLVVAETPGDGIADHIARHDPARVLREVEAGRRILARYEDCLARMEDPDYPQGVAADQAREYEDFVLPNLAAAWSGHPDYDQEWNP